MALVSLHSDFFDHPKTVRLVRLLGKGSEVVPIRLWCMTAKFFAGTGRLTGISAQEIEQWVGWWGQEGEAVRALKEVGFLEEFLDGFQVHDWGEYTGAHGARPKGAHTGAPRGAPRAKSGSIYNSSSFIPPSLEEVREYCAERARLGKPQVDPEQFYAHYTANGWVQGTRNRPIRDWKACVWTWERSDFRRAPAPKAGGQKMSERVKARNGNV